MKFCGKCGAKLEDSSKFCPKCGEKSEDLSQLFPEQVPVKKKGKRLPAILALIALVLVAAVVATLLPGRKETVYLLTSQKRIHVANTMEYEWEYDAEGRIVRYYSASIDPYGSAVMNGVTFAYAYDDQGRLEEMVQTEMSSGEEPVIARYDYRYSGGWLDSCLGDGIRADFLHNSDGDIIGRTVEGDWDGYDDIKCSYYNNGQLKRIVRSQNDYEFIHEYDEEGILRLMKNTYCGETTLIYEYNEYGHPTRMESYSYSSHNGEVECTLVLEEHISYTYKKGEITEFTIRDETGSAHGEVLTEGNTKTYRTSGSSERYGNVEAVLVHDDHGNLLEQTYYFDGEMTTKVTNTYEAFEVEQDHVIFNTYDPKYMIR